jgi:hypothetical protein
MARNPNTTWEMLDHAMSYYQTFISSKKSRTSLTVVDLLHVSNFKGGNASITEPEETLSMKLRCYQKVLEDIASKFNGKALSQLSEEETAGLVKLCDSVSSLTKGEKTRIRGFGASYASALLAAHFMELIPVLDRRILNGASIEVTYDKQKQVQNISQYYGGLIRACRAELQKRKNITLRELDKEWFVKAL